MGCAGGETYRPTTSRTLATKFGPVETLSPSGAAGAQRPPGTLHRRHRQAAGLCHTVRTPMSGALRAVFQRPHDHGFDATIANGAQCSRARLIVQPGHALLHKALPPFAYRSPLQAQLGRHFLVLTAFRAGQHDPRSQNQLLGRSFAALSATEVQYGHHRSISRAQVARPRSDPPSLLRPVCHSSANLTGIYDCQLLTRDTSFRPDQIAYSDNGARSWLIRHA